MRYLVTQSDIRKNENIEKKRPRYFIHSLAKGLSMLTCLSKQNSPLSLSAVARLNQMNLPTASRYLRTLSDLGYIVLDSSSQKYILTQRVMALGLGFLSNMDLRMRVQPHLVNLSREFNISTQCAILDETDIVYVERIRGPGLVDFNITAGTRLPAYCTALGRAILANLKPKNATQLIDKMELKKRTRFTVDSKQGLLTELNQTRLRGYAQNLQEVTIGYANYAAPIFNNGEVEAAIGISFPLDLMKDRSFLNSVISKLLNTAKDISIGS